MESRESSSPVVTRSVAAALNHEIIPGYEFSWFERLGLRLLGYLPSGLSQLLVPWAQRSGGLDPRTAASITSEGLIGNRLMDYRNLHGPFPAAVVGVAQGGTTAHLARLLNAHSYRKLLC